VPIVTCGRCHKYGHATKDYRVYLGDPNSSVVQQVQQNNNRNREQLAESLLLVEMKLHSLITFLKVFILSLGHNYLYCLI